MGHRWLKPSMPRRAARLRKGGSKTRRERTASARPLWRGTPNLDPKGLRTRAMAVSSIQYFLLRIFRPER